MLHDARRAPLTPAQAARAKRLARDVAETHPAALETDPGLRPPPRPRRGDADPTPAGSSSKPPGPGQRRSIPGQRDDHHHHHPPLESRLEAAQAVIDSLRYNHTGEGYFSVDKNRPLGRVLDTARSILRDALPIKCVEAVFLGLLLTDEWRDCDRMPAAFKTSVLLPSGQRRAHRHIVLLVRRARAEEAEENDASENRIHSKPSESDDDASADDAWGALGISRRKALAYRPLRSGSSLGEVLESYRDAYAELGHRVDKVRLGLPVPRSGQRGAAEATPRWRHCAVRVAPPGDDQDGSKRGPNTTRTQHPNASEDTSRKKKEGDGEGRGDVAVPARTWAEARVVFDAHAARCRRDLPKGGLSARDAFIVGNGTRSEGRGAGASRGGGGGGEGAAGATVAAA